MPCPTLLSRAQKLCNYTATLRTGEGSDEGLWSMEQGLKVELALVSGGVQGELQAPFGAQEPSCYTNHG